MPKINPQLAQVGRLLDAGRNAEAILLLNQLAAANDPDALLALGQFKWAGGIMPSEPVRARELFKRSAEAGNAEAGVNLTNLMASGIAGPRDWSSALRRLQREAKGDARRRQALDLLKQMDLDDDGDPVSLPEGAELSSSPGVMLFPRLLSAAECAFLRKSAEPFYAPSTVNDSSGRPVRDPLRTSDGGTLHWLAEDPAVHALNRRLAAVSATKAEQGEALQILRYRKDQQYLPHLDFVRRSENQRFQTALVYLNDDYEGGETCFVKTGLRVKGRRGDAIVFRNAQPDRDPDPMSEHASLPVTRGTKYLASRWIREQRWVP